MSDKKIKIYIEGEKILRNVAKKVPIKDISTEKFQKIIQRMKRVILENDDAVAVAAPQIGEPWRITVISEWALVPDTVKPKTELKNMVFINPEITKVSKKQKLLPEGCLSTPKIYGEVKRSEKATVEAYDETGKKFMRGTSGVLAQAIQHEIDHLNGILFIDKASNLADISDKN